jgi:HipA-like protein
MKKNLLSVQLHGKQIGILEQTLSGKKIFTYDAAATEKISMAMPIRQESYDELPCEAFFGGLLPESETARKIIGKQYGVSHNNSF